MVMRISVTVSKDERQYLPKTFMTRKGSKSFFSVAILDDDVMAQLISFGGGESLPLMGREERFEFPLQVLWSCLSGSGTAVFEGVEDITLKIEEGFLEAFFSCGNAAVVLIEGKAGD